jgi:predicted phage baseplate assembly protein
MTCPCDIEIFPRALTVPAALGVGAFQKQRALGIFPDWRLSTLAAIGAKPELDAWRARGRHDLGLMLVEMGAYVFDVCAFYDALVAGEAFLDTAQFTGAHRRLVAVLGYVPRPAVGARAYLAAIADGQRVISLPARTAFGSGEFNGNPPQVFELEQATSIDPRINRFTIERVARDAITEAAISSVLVDPASVRVSVGDPIVLDFGSEQRTARVANLTPAPLRSRTPAARLAFSAAVTVPAGAAYSKLRILGGGGTTGLWKLGELGTDTETAISGTNVLLESRASLRPGDLVLFEKEGALEARRVTATIERQRTLLPVLKSTIKDTSNVVTGTVESPPVTVAITLLTLDSALSWVSADAAKIVVRHPLSAVARVLVPLKDTLERTDPISIPALIDAPRVNVSRLLLEDVHQEGVSTSGSLDAATHSAAVNQGEDWGKTLTAAVTLFGNVLEVSRGESVSGESLGLGDASQPLQTFKLAKKPLTYLSAPTPSGIKTTLAVRVGGILWREVESFYGKTDADRVYIVRQDDEGESFVTFGGGARLPSGAQVTADYRYGAGAAVPPAGSITQLTKPIVGVNSVRNVLPAFGGADAESARELAVYAPRSVLLLERAISLPDLEAAAATTPGVQAARAVWRWDPKGTRAVAQIQYIGADALREVIHGRLRSMCEPDAPIAVMRSLPQVSALTLDVEVREEFAARDVIGAVREALYGAPDVPGTGGLLRAERLGPEGIVFLSHIAAAVMDVAGVASLRTVSFDGTPFLHFGRRPALGHYFDFGDPQAGTSRLVINGEA